MSWKVVEHVLLWTVSVPSLIVIVVLDKCPKWYSCFMMYLSRFSWPTKPFRNMKWHIVYAAKKQYSTPCISIFISLFHMIWSCESTVMPLGFWTESFPLFWSYSPGKSLAFAQHFPSYNFYWSNKSVWFGWLNTLFNSLQSTCCVGSPHLLLKSHRPQSIWMDEFQIFRYQPRD